MLSMTGFGKAKLSADKRIWSAEIRSVNSKYLDCQVRIPSRLSYLEESVKPILLSCGILRGKVDVSIRIEDTAGRDLPRLDKEKARAYLDSMRELSRELDIPNDLTVTSLLGIPELLEQDRDEENPEEALQSLTSVLREACEQFTRKASEEAQRLKADLLQKLSLLEDRTNRIESNSAQIVRDYKTRFENRLRTILSDEKIRADEARILTECAIFADKVAVDEEIVRLRSHIASFKKTLDDDGAVGK
ncbi:MAG: DUF1732 domain-containing protein, partial [Clostridia bacterium]|nr:DUF1732 domain-containing protein [Clostridia bacterium]